MPVRGGEQAFDLFAIRPDVPILLASGYDQSDAVARTADRNIAGFLQKPFDVNRLTEAVASALGLEKRIDASAESAWHFAMANMST